MTLNMCPKKRDVPPKAEQLSSMSLSVDGLKSAGSFSWSTRSLLIYDLACLNITFIVRDIKIANILVNPGFLVSDSVFHH